MADLPEDWTPPHFPAHDVLTGAWSKLEPLDPARHGAGLARAFAGADSIWKYLPPQPPADDAALQVIIANLASRKDILPYALIDLASGRATGFLTIMEIRPGDCVAEIGYVAFSPRLQRTQAATEAIFLLLRHVFDAGYRRVEWKCDNDNLPSRRAATRFGFQYEGLFRQHMVRKRRNRDTAWFSMLDDEWPQRRLAFEVWLTAENFDSSGMQRAPLARDS